MNNLNEVELSSIAKSTDEIKLQEKRFDELKTLFNEKFSPDELYYFTSPGRIEIGGNHTDHNHGCILAAAIDMDTVAVASKTDNNTIEFFSKEMDRKFTVDLSNLEKKNEETGSTSALIRGIASKFVNDGYKIGGFNSIVESKIGIGSGLSSSASIEVLIGTILNSFYNEGKIDPVEIAKVGQFSENKYFGKPCGLMDQLAIAYGGIIAVDFKNPEKPVIDKIEIDFSDLGLSVAIVDTGGTHANLTADYASIPHEMKLISQHFGESVCRFISREQIIDNLQELRVKYGDRAVLRAFHFLEENGRVGKQTEALKEKNIRRFLELINESGNSSSRWLQNIYSIKDYKSQNINIALTITENFLKENNSTGACRVHGGGFAGTILAFIETANLTNYIPLMEKVFGQNSVKVVSIRNSGACMVKL